MFSSNVLNGFRIHSAAALEIAPDNPDYHAFIGVYPAWQEKRIPNWRVHRFEIAKGHVGNWFRQEDLVDLKRTEVKTIEEVEELIRSWGYDPAGFRQSVSTEYPL